MMPDQTKQADMKTGNTAEPNFFIVKNFAKHKSKMTKPLRDWNFILAIIIIAIILTMLSPGIHGGCMPGPLQTPTTNAITVCYTKWFSICRESMHFPSYSHMSHTGISPLRLHTWQWSHRIIMEPEKPIAWCYLSYCNVTAWHMSQVSGNAKCKYPYRVAVEVKQSTLVSVQHIILDHAHKRQCGCLCTNYSFYHYFCVHFYWYTYENFETACYVMEQPHKPCITTSFD